MSTGAKVGLGCGGCLVVILAAVGITVALGGGWIAQRAGEVVDGLQQQTEAQAEATELLERLEREHPFEPPAEPTLEPEQARRFFRVTDSAWEELGSWAGELEELERRIEERDPGLTDVGAVAEGFGKLAESRLVLARALEEEEVSLDEYVWTGSALIAVHEAMERDEDPGVPEGTREVIRERRSVVEEMAGDRDDEIGRELVFQLAGMWSSVQAGDLRGLASPRSSDGG